MRSDYGCQLGERVGSLEFVDEDFSFPQCDLFFKTNVLLFIESHVLYSQLVLSCDLVEMFYRVRH